MPVVRELITRLGAKTDLSSFEQADSAIEKLKTAAKAAAAVFITGAFAKGMTSAVKAASDANEQLNVLQQGFGDLTPEIMKWARVTAKEVGRSEFALRDFVGINQIMLTSLLGSKSAAIDMGKSIAVLAVDLGSFFNIAEKDTLRALRSGLTGEIEPLKRLGIVMTQASLDQFALAKGLGKQVAKMTEAEKVALRYKFIMDRTKDAQGDAARTSEGLANAGRALTDAINDLRTRLGLFLLPAVEKVVRVFRDITRAASDWLDTNSSILKSGIDIFFRDVFQLLSSLGKTATRVKNVFVAFFNSLSPGTKQVLKLMAAIAAFILIPGAGIALLGTVILGLIDDIETFTEGGGSLIGRFFEWFENKTGISVEEVKKTFAGIFETVKTVFTNVMNFLGDIFGKMVGFIADKASKAFEAVFSGDLFKKITEAISNFFADATKETDGESGGLIQSFVEFSSQVVDKVLSVLDALSPLWQGKFREFGAKVLAGFSKVTEDVIGAVSGLFSAGVEIWKEHFSGAWDSILKTIGGFVGKLLDELNKVFNAPDIQTKMLALSKIIGAVLLAGVAAFLGYKFVKMIGGLMSGDVGLVGSRARRSLGGIKDAAGNIIKGAEKKGIKAPGFLSGFVGDLGSGLIDSIKSPFGGILTGGASTLKKQLFGVLGFGSQEAEETGGSSLFSKAAGMANIVDSLSTVGKLLKNVSTGKTVKPSFLSSASSFINQPKTNVEINFQGIGEGMSEQRIANLIVQKTKETQDTTFLQAATAFANGGLG